MIKLFPDGSKSYYNLNGKLHRENGPAIIYSDGSKAYFINGNRHRVTGPAIEYSDGNFEYWYKGKYISTLSQKEFERYIKLLAFI